MVNVWHSSPNTVDFNSLAVFKRRPTIKSVVSFGSVVTNMAVKFESSYECTYTVERGHRLWTYNRNPLQASGASAMYIFPAIQRLKLSWCKS